MQNLGLWKLQASIAFLLLLLNITVAPCLSHKETKTRQKRILWITQDGRLALPPGTTMVVTPSLSLPFVRYPPEGFFSNMTISLPFTSELTQLLINQYKQIY